MSVLRSPDAANLREILERSVAAAGHAFEDAALTEEIAAVVVGEQAALPLLQVAGQLLWERRDRQKKVLRRADYEDLGGVGGALARHADGVLDGQSSEQVRLARELLLRLVTPEGARRVVARSELLDGLASAAGQVLDRLIDGRLVHARRARRGRGHEAELELAHESLVRTWDRLARWFDGSREEMAFLAEVGQAAELWERRGSPVDETWEGDALDDAARRLATLVEVPPTVERFVAAGGQRRARLRRQRRVAASLGVGALVVIAAVMAGLFLDARAQRDWAQQKIAEVQREGARAAWMKGDLLEARAKLRMSLETEDSPLARALWRQLQQSPEYWRKRLGGRLWDVCFSPDGDRVAVACDDGAIYLFGTLTREQRVLRGHSDQVTAVAFDRAGGRLVSGASNGEVGLWDLAEGGLSLLYGHRDRVVAAAFSPAGDRIATAGADDTVRLWDPATGAAGHVLEGHEGDVNGVDFTPDGELLVSGGS
ncbi:MAG: hypothetical protein QGH45_08685, partial [Myxococcota bacterium]|nr:hypothetical protein [Myxococcota bacterium]